jgi:hypothetical protein
MVTTNGLRNNQKNDKNLEQTCLALKYPLDQEPPELTPREFCRRMHGLAELEEVDILRAELQPGYRKRCIGLLSKVLDVKRTSVINWGTSLEFEKMPKGYRRVLGMWFEHYQLQAEVRRLRRLSS